MRLWEAFCQEDAGNEERGCAYGGQPGTLEKKISRQKFLRVNPLP